MDPEGSSDTTVERAEESRGSVVFGGEDKGDRRRYIAH